ncbi:hypothetical protein [Actibacterium sp. XHP0104]|uniref:hypothetical protein n=1 Tax=Actibacterium sp. XHP0104 TaxID=2984335 RepID=UPI0021E880E8|nr:hypothetical protein [Actibacterium sp. XHP0104]MCV2882303.1 hypothetical protein [Actibacterium sp. XHP0104]
MPFALIDEMTEDALRGLLSGAQGWRGVVRDLAARFPAAPPQAMIFALTSAGSGIESSFAPDSAAHPASNRAYRLAALVAADLYAMQIVGARAETLADLLAYWRRHDDYFLTL